MRGFPKIKRAMLLKPALLNNFRDIPSVAVEEKMNGYNVRVLSSEESSLLLHAAVMFVRIPLNAFRIFWSRIFSGNILTFVIYGEMAGPENPYVQKDAYGIESLDFFVFDIRYKNTGEACRCITERTCRRIWIQSGQALWRFQYQ